MRFFDFPFGKRKDEQPKARPKGVTNSSVQSISTLTTSGSFQPQAKPVAYKSSIPSTEPFVFKSDWHQRFENGHEVMGLQQCGRTVSVEKNTNECRGDIN